MTREVDLPWVPIWVDDFRGSRTVATMTDLELGVYVKLLLEEWKNGPLPPSPETIAHIVRSDPEVVAAVLDAAFVCDGDAWRNERLEHEWGEQHAKYQKKVRAGKASGTARRRKSRNERRSNAAQTPLKHRSNTARTPLEHRSNTARTEDERKTNQPEPESEPEPKKKTDVQKKERSVDRSDVENSGPPPDELGEGPIQALPGAAREALVALRPPSLRGTVRTLEARWLYDDDDDATLGDPVVRGLPVGRRREIVAGALLEFAAQADGWNARHFASFVRRLRNAPRPGTEAYQAAQRPEPPSAYSPPRLTTPAEPRELARIDVRHLLEQHGVRPPGAREGQA